MGEKSAGLKFQHSNAFRKCTSPYKWLIWRETIATSLISDIEKLNPTAHGYYGKPKTEVYDKIIENIKQLLPEHIYVQMKEKDSAILKCLVNHKDLNNTKV